MSSGRRKGPIGGIIGMLGTGVGAVAEYHEHRKEQKLSRENSKQDANAEAGPSPSNLQPTPSSSSDLPPAYTDAVEGTSDRSLASGKPVSEDKKAALAQYDDDSSDGEDDNSTEDDEEDWELDELNRKESSGLPSYEESEKYHGNNDDLVRDVMSKSAALAPKPANAQPFLRQPLPCPVIIPQRRPRNRTRGFVRAYAPLLGECSGIDQETFLSFLENFYKSSQASSVFGVIQLSAAIAGFAPEPITMAVTTAVQIAARTGAEVQSRYRTNDFLNKMNDELFKPAGLYAMIVKYKSDAEVQASGNSLLARFGVAAETVDFNTNETIAKYNRTISNESDGSSKGMSQRLQNIRLASGTTKGTINLPAAAPLVFPDVDKAIAKDGPETFKDKAKDAQGFLADYMDRRAHLKYARSDPSSTLIVPESERSFKSPLADPNHPMYNSGPLGFVTGGYLAKDRSGMGPRSDKRERKNARRLDKYERRMDSGRELSRKKQRRYDELMAEEGYDGYGGGYDRGQSGRRRRGGPIGLVGGLVGGAVGMVGGAAGAATGGTQRSREYVDSYSNRPAPHAEYGRRSFDERRSGYDEKSAYASSGNAPAPYGSSAYAASGNAPAPYGSSAYASSGNASSGNAPAPYASYGGGPGMSAGRQQYPRRAQKGGGGPLGVVKRIMTEDVLYLMIVNMPSEAEMAAALEKLERAKSGH